MTHELALVTGYPRAVARLIAQELLRTEGQRVALVVRSRDLDLARDFIASLGEDSARVELLEGDVTAIDLGLAGAEFNGLARRVTAVYHAAQWPHEASDAKALRAMNVQGTREAVALVRAAKETGRAAPRLVALSSTLVAGDHQGVFREGDLDVGQSFRSEVEASLFRAEVILRRATDIPVTVVRPAVIVGHSETGEIDVLDGPYLFVLLLLNSPVDLKLPLPVGAEAAMQLVPVDFVARAAVALGRSPRSIGRTFHVVDPSPLSSRRVFDLVARAAGRRPPGGFVPVQLTRTVLRAPGVEGLMRSPRAFFERLASRASFPSSAREVLGPAEVECPPFERYVDALVDYVRARVERRREPSAPRVEGDVEDPLA